MRRSFMALALTAVWANAQAPVDTPMQFGDVTFTGSLRSRFYDWNWFQAATGENQYEYSGNLLRLNFAKKSGGFEKREMECHFPRTALLISLRARRFSRC